MIKREDFMFTVGFDGATAIVDGDARRRFARLDVDQLLDQGLYRAAVSAAVFDRDGPALEKIRDAFARASGSPIEDPQDLLKIFGIPTQVLVRAGEKSATRQYKVEVL